MLCRKHAVIVAILLCKSPLVEANPFVYIHVITPVTCAAGPYGRIRSATVSNVLFRDKLTLSIILSAKMTARSGDPTQYYTGTPGGAKS